MEQEKNHLVEILNRLAGTHEEEILKQMEKLYDEIKDIQSVWYEKSGFTCPEGCGKCCKNFERICYDI